jgi:hypothetical protein
MARMKKLLCIWCLVFGIWCLPASAASTNVVTNLFSLAYNNGTNAGGVYYVSNVIVPLQSWLIQSLGITNVGSGSYTTNGITNVLRVNLQWSVDPANSNWVTIGSWTPSTTNATVESWNTNIGYLALPIRAQIVTTNTIGASVFTQ